MNEPSWLSGLDPVARDNWTRLCASTAGGLTGAPLPDGMTTADLTRTLLQVAAAKGLIWLEHQGEHVNVTVTAAGHPITPHLSAITAGRFDTWGHCVNAVEAAAAVPLVPRPAQLGPPPASRSTLDAPSAFHAFARIRELHPLVATGAYRVTVGPAGKPTHIAWMPVDEAVPLPRSDQALAEIRTPSGRWAVAVHAAALPDLLSFAALDAGLATTHRVGTDFMIIPLPGHEDIWHFFEAVGTGRLELPVFFGILDRLIRRGPVLAM